MFDVRSRYFGNVRVFFFQFSGKAQRVSDNSCYGVRKSYTGLQSRNYPSYKLRVDSWKSFSQTSNMCTALLFLRLVVFAEIKGTYETDTGEELKSHPSDYVAIGQTLAELWAVSFYILESPILLYNMCVESHIVYVVMYIFWKIRSSVIVPRRFSSKARRVAEFICLFDDRYPCCYMSSCRHVVILLYTSLLKSKTIKALAHL